ncbi:MAG TPA: peroxide stress protein YaaA [Propionibacteriaceae bacterium]|nr:peroxide stress protein YaaA [Propionibacteriaceae bacterium]
MLALLSPAKTLDLESALPTRKHTEPRMLDESRQLIDVMVTRTPEEIAALMGISDELADLNARRYRDFELPFTTRNARPAVLTFAGDVYQGMAVRERFTERDFTEATKTLRILSGLYGLLRPLDLIQPYRLEMGVRLRTGRGRNLYEWWGERITDLVRADLAASPGANVLVNLASQEYFAAVDADALDSRVVSPRFEDEDPQGRYRVVGFSAKRARGEMAAWLVLNRVRSARALSEFDAAGYRYAAEESTPDAPVFRRPRRRV